MELIECAERYPEVIDEMVASMNDDAEEERRRKFEAEARQKLRRLA